MHPPYLPEPNITKAPAATTIQSKSNKFLTIQFTFHNHIYNVPQVSIQIADTKSSGTSSNSVEFAPVTTNSPSSVP